MQANLATELLFEMSQPGRRTHRLPPCDVPAAPVEALLPADCLAEPAAAACPRSARSISIRHFVNLSKRNMSIDTNFYPLGSCTMKYNPKRHERLAALPGMADLHPLQSDASCQGMLQILWEMQNILAEIAGLDVVSPAAGRRGPGRADRPAGRRGLLPRSQGDSAPGCSSPTAPTAPTRPAPPSPGSTPSPSRATPRAWSTWTTSRPSSTSARPCS